MDMIELDRLPKHPDGGQASRWKCLLVDGLVRRSVALTHEDLTMLPTEEIEEDYQCEEGWVVPAQRWQGVPVREVLATAEPLAEARWVSFAAGGFSVALTLEEAQTSRALLATRLNGQPLPPSHGGPCRLVVAGKECFFSVKWLDRIEASSSPSVETARAIALQRIGKL